MKKGILVSFEGIDGCGKTTQIDLFIQRLEQANISFSLYREPGGTLIGEKIRAILLDNHNIDLLPFSESLLYAASRHQLCCQKIKPDLEKGMVVICDRFYDSTTAYQGYGRGIDLDFIRQLNTLATDSMQPDLTYVLDISLQERSRRIARKDLDRLEREAEEFQERVRQGFYSIADQEPERVKIIDGAQAPQKIALQIWHYFLNKWEGNKS